MTSLRSQGLALAGLLLSTVLAAGLRAAARGGHRGLPAADALRPHRGQRRRPGAPRAATPWCSSTTPQRPPPPQGTGRPVAFTIIPLDELYGTEVDQPTSGPFTAPFTFPLVRPGSYLLRGFIDTDPCRATPVSCHGSDFIPWYNVTAEPNVGDVGGAAVDVATRAPRVFEVREAEDGTPHALCYGRHRELLGHGHGRRTAPSSTWWAPRRLIQRRGIQVFKLRSRPITEGVVNLRSPVFLVRFMDENRDGVPDRRQQGRRAGLWPRAAVRKLSDGGNGLTDENDLDNNGVVDTDGVDYAHVDGTQDGQPDVVVLGTVLLADALLPAGSMTPTAART